MCIAPPLAAKRHVALSEPKFVLKAAAKFELSPAATCWDPLNPPWYALGSHAVPPSSESQGLGFNLGTNSFPSFFNSFPYIPSSMLCY